MALVTCSGCNAQISKKAKECPKCGTGLNKRLAECRSCGAMLDVDKIMFSTGYEFKGTTHHKSSQFPCPECGEPKPFDLASQINAGAGGGFIITMVGIAFVVVWLVVMFNGPF